MIYSHIIRPVLFKLTDAETIHHWTVYRMGEVSRVPFLYKAIHNYCAVNDERLKVQLGSIALPNPVGLAAGFDKYIDAPYGYPMLGFGWAELGSITYGEQPGNPRPRVWRLPKDKGIVVFYGLPNSGAVKTAEKIKIALAPAHPIPLGISIAPTNKVEIADMPADYFKSLELVLPYADFITLNVSCPNVAKADVFSQISFICELLHKMRAEMDRLGSTKPFFLKIAPGYDEAGLQQIAEAAIASRTTGIIATNLIKDRSKVTLQSSTEELNHPGGISGLRLQDMSNFAVSTLYKKCQGKVHVIGLGGIFTAEDAYQRIRAGASALQLITGFVYGGPLVLKKINQGLLKLLERDGFKNIGEVVGVDVK